MHKLKFRLARKTLGTTYISFIRPVLEYTDVVGCNTKHKEDELDKIQLEAARIILVQLNYYPKKLAGRFSAEDEDNIN